MTGYEHYDETLERKARFKKDIPASDPATAAYLIAAWKEQMIGDLVSLFQSTDDPYYLGIIDGHIAIVRDNVAVQCKISELESSKNGV